MKNTTKEATHTHKPTTSAILGCEACFPPEAQHTPTPWFRNIKADGKYPVIFAGRNQHVCTVSQQITGAETEANIDFIVRAVNSHEALIEAINKLMDIYNGVRPDRIPDHMQEFIKSFNTIKEKYL